MSEPRRIIEPLARHHERGAFSSGVASLDRYLRQQARQDMERRVAAVFVLVGDSPDQVAGYYTLSATGVLLSDAPPDVVRHFPRYPVVPAILLGRLAVDTRFRGRRYGELLLLDALYRGLCNRAEIGAAAIIVDARDADARTFYGRYGFVPFPTIPFRLFLPMRAVKKVWANILL